VRVLGLDVGDRRIGVALSDPTGLIASPLMTIHRVAERKDHDVVIGLAQEYFVERIVIGLPKTLHGDLGFQALRVMRFGEHLAKVVSIPIDYWDERHSTVDAKRIVRSRERRKARTFGGALDEVAAAVILQFYLDSQRTANSEQ
jgi:putative Holliday junction resolvase